MCSLYHKSLTMTDTSTSRSDLLVWLDMEMTGLDPLTDRILELAIIITEQDLTEVAVSPIWVVHQFDDVLDNMNDWCKNVHGKNGLVDRSRNSSTNESQVQEDVIKWLSQYVNPGTAPLCGNSIHQDILCLLIYNRILHVHMRELINIAMLIFFHYKLIDVSSFRLVADSHKPGLSKGYKKQQNHSALDDVRESIGEMKFYLDNWLLR